ncbi:GroES-like protein [Astrocystis sublimbata]|nr:GroES-like protein [Astrocystis sublimbata]
MAEAKALVVHSVKSPADIKFTTREIPKATPGSAVVRVLATIIGPGHGYLVSHEVPGFSFPTPCVYGNQSVGRVVSVGPDAVSLKEGQLVLIDPFASARDDSTAEIIIGLMDSGEPKAQQLSQTWRDGCWQTHAMMPLENVIPLDEDTLVNKHGYAIEELPIMARFSVAYGAISNIDLKAGETIIIGPATGQFGGAAVELASALGARVIALGRNQEVLAKLKATVPRVETVALTGDVQKDAQAIQAFGLADAFLDSTPHTAHEEPSHIKSALFSLRKRGRVAFMGGMAGNLTIPYFILILKSLVLKGKWMYTPEEIRRLVKMVEVGTVKIGKAAGHELKGKFQLEDYEAAFEAAAKNAAWGQSVVFTP